jgi:TonB-dependent receptor
MAEAPKPKKDRTSLIISLVFHALLIGAIGYWMQKSGALDAIKETILKLAQGDKKKSGEEVKPIQTKAPPPAKLPPINQGYTPPSGGGTRRAVAEDAPAASGGESFFADTRTQGGGPSSGGAGGKGGTNAPPPKIVISLPPPPKPLMAAPRKSTVTQLHTERAKAAAATESFGTEQISKSGVSDAGAIVNKIAGATIVDGKFAVIRGLSDRYVTTELNGAEIPSADPYRRSAGLDMFPAQIIDRVVVSKTFMPDQQGAYTGGGINIITKSFPEKAFVSFSGGAAYNTQATGNDKFLTYNGGSKDWLGTDDGTRALPPNLSGASTEVPLPPPNTPSPRTDPAGYQQAVNAANRLQAQTKELGLAQFAPQREAPGPDFNMAFAMGDTTRLFMQPLGMFASMSYKQEHRFFDDGTQGRYGTGIGGGESEERSRFHDSVGTTVVNWSAMVNLAYQLHPDHQAAFTFLYNQNGIDLARVQVGKTIEQSNAEVVANRLQFTERNLQTYQFKGESLFPEAADIKLNWQTALSSTTQDEPDTRFFNYGIVGDNTSVGDPYLPEPKNPTRYWRNLDEQNLNYKLDITTPLQLLTSKPTEFKMGMFSSHSDRNYLDQEFYYQGQAAWNGDPNAYLTPNNLGYDIARVTSTGRIVYSWERYIQQRQSAYNGPYGVYAGYGMLDMPLLESLRLVGGMRYELTDISIDSRSYLPNSVTGETTNHTTLNQQIPLPAVGLIWALNTNMNLRLHYSQTIARPSYRELAAIRTYDPILDTLLEGNPELQITEANNYDFRWEWFPSPGDLLSFSAFYKSLTLPIERRFVTQEGDIITFDNRPDATVYGVEFEGRKNLGFINPSLSYFSVGGNLSLIESETELTREELNSKLDNVPGASATRPLYDQAPYVLNLELSYDHPGWGTSFSVLYNVAGPRVVIASLNTEDVYLQPSSLLDIVVSQRLTRHISLRFTAKNILNPELKRTYGKDSDLIYSSSTVGTTFGISLSGEF